MKTLSELVECSACKGGVFFWTFEWPRVGVSQKRILREKLTCQNRGGGGGGGGVEKHCILSIFYSII